MTTTADQIRSAIETCVANVAALIRKDTIQKISAALGEDPPTHKGAKKAKAKPTGAARSGKRTAEDLEKIGLTIVSWVEKNPGVGVEQIASGIEIDSGELKLPIKKLLADGALKTKGQKRGTKYFAK